MKTWQKILVGALVAALLSAAAAAAVLISRARQAQQLAAQMQQQEQAAEQAHTEAYTHYARMVNAAANIALTVTEQGEPVGAYTLAQLGLWEDTLAQIDQCFDATTRIIPTEFQSLPYEEKIAWRDGYRPAVLAATVPLEQLDLSAVWADLGKTRRTAAADAYVTFSDGAYHVHPEQAGNQLDEQAVAQALTGCLRQLSIEEGELKAVAFEVTEIDCYLQPEITVATADFDYNAMLSEALRKMDVTVSFYGQPRALTRSQLSALVTVSEDGRLQVSDQELSELAAALAEEYDRTDTPYLLNSHEESLVPVHFLHVDYALDQQALQDQLRAALPALESWHGEAPMRCTRKGEPFSLGEEYVEVDVKNQVMTYVKDGEVLVCTDVVTGSAWLSPTPEGLYQVENKIPETWLIGADFTVYVDYWIGFIGYYYGLHDADWRTEFGGDNYITNGSHGCVNTPKEEIAKIYENISIGVPVLVYGPER